MELIECEFEEMGEYCGLLYEEDPKTKLGRYEGGNLNVTGLGTTCWAVVANIIPSQPIATLLAAGLTEGKIVEGCFAFLNKRPYRARKPRYGLLSPRFFVVINRSGKISVSFTTTDRNNKYFWGRGSKTSVGRKVTKRGRPRKVR
tara:strand:- start:1757 stop:2191 length:435 start_codon:yes stop_codon:yes gene_type:complete